MRAPVKRGVCSRATYTPANIPLTAQTHRNSSTTLLESILVSPQAGSPTLNGYRRVHPCPQCLMRTLERRSRHQHSSPYRPKRPSLQRDWRMASHRACKTCISKTKHRRPSQSQPLRSVVLPCPAWPPSPHCTMPPGEAEGSKRWVARQRHRLCLCQSRGSRRDRARRPPQRSTTTIRWLGRWQISGVILLPREAFDGPRQAADRARSSTP